MSAAHLASQRAEDSLPRVTRFMSASVCSAHIFFFYDAANYSQIGLSVSKQLIGVFGVPSSTVATILLKFQGYVKSVLFPQIGIIYG